LGFSGWGIVDFIKGIAIIATIMVLMALAVHSFGLFGILLMGRKQTSCIKLLIVG